MSGGDDTLESEMEGEEEEEEEEEMSTPMHETEEVKEEGGGWQDEHVCEMVEGAENWRIVGLLNVGNTCFTNAVLQVFSYRPFHFWPREEADGLDKLRF